MILREFTLNDAPILASLLNDNDISKWTAQIPYPYTLNDAVEWISSHQSSDRNQLAIEYDGVLVGCISYWSVGSNSTEIGYWVAKTFWGKGIATKAISTLLSSAYFPDQTNVVATVMVHNFGSQRVLAKSGFNKANTCDIIKNGRKLDAFLYIKLKAS